MAVKGKKRRGAPTEHENEERWLLTYADMITLLMALFMVMFSIANVNQAKLQALSTSLSEAFSGKILPGGESINQNGAGSEAEKPAPTPPIPAITPLVADAAAKEDTGSAAREEDDFKRIKREIDAYAQANGLKEKVQTTITERGLEIRLLTDEVLFDSGGAALKPQADALLSKVSDLLRISPNHDISVEGHTDNVPIRGSLYPTNWELSTARASGVVRFLIAHGAQKMRMSASGYASLHPISNNTTVAGRARNRRVEIVLLRAKAGADKELGGSFP